MLPEDLVASAKRWQEWMDLSRPEEEPLPGPSFAKVLTAIACHPDTAQLHYLLDI